MKKTQDLHQQAVSGFLQGWLQAPWPEDLGTVNLPSWTISDPLNQLFWVKLEAAFFMYSQEDSHVQEPFQVKTGPMSYILLREEVTQYTHMSKIIITMCTLCTWLKKERERERTSLPCIWNLRKENQGRLPGRGALWAEPRQEEKQEIGERELRGPKVRDFCSRSSGKAGENGGRLVLRPHQATTSFPPETVSSEARKLLWSA